MIDTVRLILDEGTFVIQRPWLFQPNAQGILDMAKSARGSGLIKAVLNPSKDDLKNGNYSPRLTLRRRPPNVTELVIEFSIPKLLYGNNFDEVSEHDFGALMAKLTEKLADVGVYVRHQDLKYAPVGAIHYGKNIVLSRHTLCQSLIRMLNKVQVNLWFDVNKVDFRNEGHLYKVHSNHFELAFYDKVKDLKQAQKSEKRAYETDTVIQGNLFDYFEVATEMQVLRMEVRLNTRTQIKRKLLGLGMLGDDLRFQALFKQSIAQAILLHFWKPYSEQLPLLAMAHYEETSGLLEALQRQDPSRTIGNQLQCLGALKLVAEVGWNGLRAIWTGSDRSFLRLKKQLEPLSEGYHPDFAGAEIIETTLRTFKPVKMDEYQIKCSKS